MAEPNPIPTAPTTATSAPLPKQWEVRGLYFRGTGAELNSSEGSHPALFVCDKEVACCLDAFFYVPRTSLYAHQKSFHASHGSRKLLLFSVEDPPQIYPLDKAGLFLCTQPDASTASELGAITNISKPFCEVAPNEEVMSRLRIILLDPPSHPRNRYDLSPPVVARGDVVTLHDRSKWIVVSSSLWLQHLSYIRQHSARLVLTDTRGLVRDLIHLAPVVDTDTPPPTPPLVPLAGEPGLQAYSYCQPGIVRTRSLDKILEVHGPVTPRSFDNVEAGLELVLGCGDRS